ncbi:hypothetical protein WJX72_006102 [[Myrmecia] bisecta]|uniref:Transmembrane protein n=1 Tax=[Myrmecia] bisecta TaxID=41462 RepID=A0AAW1Q114_9CHLO
MGPLNDWRELMLTLEEMWRGWFLRGKTPDTGSRAREPLLDSVTGPSSRASSVDFNPAVVRAKVLGSGPYRGFQKLPTHARAGASFQDPFDSQLHEQSRDSFIKAGQNDAPQLPLSNRAQTVGVSGASTPVASSGPFSHDMGAYQPLLEPLLDVDEDNEAHATSVQANKHQHNRSHLLDFDTEDPLQPLQERMQSSAQATTSGSPFANMAPLQVTSPSRVPPARSLSKRSLLRLLSHVSPQLGAALGGPPLEPYAEDAEHDLHCLPAQSPRGHFSRQLSSSSSRFSDGSQLHVGSNPDRDGWLQEPSQRRTLTDSPRSSQRSMRIARRSINEQSCQAGQDTPPQASAARQQQSSPQLHSRIQQPPAYLAYQNHTPQHSRHLSLMGPASMFAVDDQGSQGMPHQHMTASATAAANATVANDKIAGAAKMWAGNLQWVILWLVLSVLTCIHAGALIYALGWTMFATVCGAMFSWSGLLGVIGAVRTLLGHCLSRHVDVQHAIAGYKLKMIEIVGFMTASLSLLAMFINMFSFQIIMHDPHMPACPPPDAACQNSYNVIVVTMVGTTVLYGCHGLVSCIVTYKAHAVRQIVRSVTPPPSQS